MKRSTIMAMYRVPEVGLAWSSDELDAAVPFIYSSAYSSARTELD